MTFFRTVVRITRTFCIPAAMLALSAHCCFSENASQATQLSKPPVQFGVDLMTALKNRHSDKTYVETPVTAEQLATILWAANGVNRENGKRTAPAPMNMPYLQIFVIGRDGASLYHPTGHTLTSVCSKDLRGALPKQAAYASASHQLLLVADLSQFTKPEIATESKLLWAHCNAGHIGQNVYLAAAALELSTCMVAGVNLDMARAELGLRDDQIPLYLMPLGHSK